MPDATIPEALQQIADRWEDHRDGGPVDVEVKAAEPRGDAGASIAFHRRASTDTALLLSVLASLGHRMEFSGVLSCEVTDNPVGTDTWGADSPCECEACQMWLGLRRLAERGSEEKKGEVVTP